MNKEKKYFSYLLPILLLSVGTGIFFNNCSKSSFDTLRDDSSFVIASTVADESSNSDYYVSCVPKLNSKLIATEESPTASTVKYSEEVFTNNQITTSEVLIVKVSHKCLKENSNLSILSQAIKNRPEGLINDLEFGSYQFKFGTSISRSNFEAIINSDPCIAFIDKNATYYINTVGTLNDTYYSMQSHLAAIGHAEVYSKIFNSSNGINKEVRIAIIDSGVDTSNPDLIDNVLRDTYDQVIGLNAIANNRDFADSGFHGTHVAGLAAATSGNGIGVSGVLGSFVKIIPIRVSNNGSSVDLDAVINGINWATKQKADVINMSLSATGAGGDRPLLREALDNALSNGVTVVVAAGNDGQVITKDSNIVAKKDCSGKSLTDSSGKVIGMDTAHIYPMKYASSKKGLLSVGSIDALDGTISCFSNRSTEFVEIMAPGSAGSVGIISTVPSMISSLGYANKAYGGPINGTSMSSPVVAGAAALAIALARSRGYNALPEQVESLLTLGSIQDPKLSSYVRNGNRLNLPKLVSLIDQDTHISSTSTTDRSQAYGVLKISKQPVAKKVIIGDSVSFEVAPSTDSSILINYQWYRNGKIITGATSRTLTIPKVMASHAGAYQVQMSSGKTKINSEVTSLTVGNQYCN